MRTDNLSEKLREAGYEALLCLGGVLTLPLHPTERHLNDISRWIDDCQSRRQLLRRLEKRGLVTSRDQQGQWVPLLTERGRAVFAGGRHPELAWARPWDGRWRLLTFDLPRRHNQARMKLRNWLCRNQFGRLQGSVWMSPDPVVGFDKILAKGKIDPRHVMVFEGTPAEKRPPRELAATAWDFESIDSGYREYRKRTESVLRSFRKSKPTPTRLRKILRDDRNLWLEAVRCDPLLPQALHPKGYEGPAAWKLRGQLLKKLGQALNAPASLK